jgi:hypothetical protein
MLGGKSVHHGGISEFDRSPQNSLYAKYWGQINPEATSSPAATVGKIGGRVGNIKSKWRAGIIEVI